MHWYKLFVYALMGYGVLMLFYFMLNQPPASGSSNEARTQLQAQIEELEARHQLISQKLKEWQLNKKVEMTQELEKALKAELEEQPVSQPLEPKSETGRQVMTYTPPENPMDPSVLVVGGTDGSGTRSVVALLQQLGIKMVVEDAGTNDVHADVMGGWPPVVKEVIGETHSLNYEPASLAPATAASVRQSIQSLDKQLSGKAGRMGTKHKASSKVTYGFKAPVAMTLVPMFRAVLEKVRFLHVVRDGRDICFSGNQTPISKFYDLFYNKAADRKGGVEEKAIQMWSDWNSQLLDWEKAHQDQSTFDYYVLHTEDLVSTDVSTTFHTYRGLVDFLGIAMSNEEVCCLAREPPRFMGSHSANVHAQSKGSGSATVQSQYGKWKGKVGDNKALFDAIHSAGRDGLSAFGYEPERSSPPLSFQCDLTEEQCHRGRVYGFTSSSVYSSPSSSSSGSSGCQTEDPNTDYRGAGSDVGMKTAFSLPECCKLCKDHHGCSYVTYSPHAKLCYFKKSQGQKVEATGLVSASV